MAIRTRFKLVATVYYGEAVVRQDQVGVGPDSWLWDALERLEREALMRPAPKQDAASVVRGLEAAAKSEGWLSVARLPKSALRKAAVVRALRALENALESHLSDTQARNAAERVRSFVFNYLRSFDPDLRRAVKTGFKPRLTKSNPTPRALISSLPGSSSTGEPRLPIEALRHGSLQELRERRKEVLLDDLENIKRACKLELERHRAFCTGFAAMVEVPVPKKARVALEEFVIQTPDGATTDGVHLLEELGCTGRQLAALYWEITQLAEAAPLNLGRAFRLRNPAWIQQGIMAECALSEVPRDPFGYYFFGDASARVACLVGLCSHTGWNSGPVNNLTSLNILGDAPPYTIQGFKSKTGKDTPVSVIEREDELACWCVEFLRKRLFWLKAFGLVGKNETRLWLNPGRTYGPEQALRQFVGFRGDLKDFQRKYALPLFSPDQIRTQYLAISSIGDVDLGLTQDVAGHSDADTTARYLQQDLLEAFHQAVNYEYQRRLEQSVEYEGELKRTGARRDFGRSLLYPIGDGATCTNPQRPPEPGYLSAGICRGTMCHAGEEGCPNRKIVLNSHRVEENLRQVKFYRENWQALLGMYPDKFRKNHLPAMVFGVMLEAVIASGPLASVQSALKAKIETRGRLI